MIDRLPQTIALRAIRQERDIPFGDSTRPDTLRALRVALLVIRAHVDHQLERLDAALEVADGHNV